MKIGIITHYYKSTNYGGSLQAYALTKLLSSRGYEAEQICFAMDCHSFYTPPIDLLQTSNETIQKQDVVLRHKKFQKIFRRIRSKLNPKEKFIKKTVNRIRKAADDRNRKLFEFQDCIPHSRFLYSSQNFEDITDVYDCLITGSDQVWNFEWFSDLFFLNFRNISVRKIAYAVSCGKSTFNEHEQRYLHDVLQSFYAISVRESDLVCTLSEFFESKSVIWALDPVFLLTTDEWDELASDRIIPDSYCLCYFLGIDYEIKKMVESFAQENKLVLVVIPSTNEEDKGDYTLDAIIEDTASPADFISLIKNAECVFTDSFHASAFALLYNRKLVAYERAGAKEMSTRILTLTELFHCQERFCTTEEQRSLNYAQHIYSTSENKYDTKDYLYEREKSIKFLTESLDG